MAFVFDDQNDQENQNNQQKEQENGQSVNQAPTLSQSAGPASSGASPGKPSPQPQQPSSSGSYTNLQSYLNANSDQTPSTLISSKIQDVGNKAQSDLSNAQNQFESQSKSGYTAYNPDLIKNALQDPSSFAQNPDNVSAFKSQLNDQYNGPQSLSNISGYNPGEGQYASSLANETKSEEGRTALLNEFANRPTYTSGEKSLDQMLLENSPQSRQDFANLQNQFAGLGAEYANAGSQAQNEALQRASEASQAQQAASSGLNNSLNTLQSNLTATQKADQAAQQAAYNQIIQDNKNKQLSSADLARLGNLNPIGLEQTDLSNYLTQSAAPTISAVANQQQAAQLAALAKLGAQPTITLDNNQIGTYNPNTPFTFDENRYNSDRSTQLQNTLNSLATTFGQKEPFSNNVFNTDIANSHPSVPILDSNGKFTDWTASPAGFEPVLTMNNGGAGANLVFGLENLLRSYDPNQYSPELNTVSNNLGLNNLLNNPLIDYWATHDPSSNQLSDPQFLNLLNQSSENKYSQ